VDVIVHAIVHGRTQFGFGEAALRTLSNAADSTVGSVNDYVNGGVQGTSTVFSLSARPKGLPLQMGQGVPAQPLTCGVAVHECRDACGAVHGRVETTRPIMFSVSSMGNPTQRGRVGNSQRVKSSLRGAGVT